MNDKETLVSIPPSSDAVYPFGRFEKKLKKDGLYNEYINKFSKIHPEPHICPDILEWPGMAVECNGDINMCGAFEAIANPNVTVVSNILKPFEEVESDLLNLHEKEKDWFLDNLPDIAFGEKSTCKIRNNCYSN